MNPDQLCNYYSHELNSVQDYAHPIYTPSVDEMRSQYFDIGVKDEQIQFGGYQFADMHEVLRSDMAMYSAPRNSPPISPSNYMYYPGQAIQDPMHYVVSQPIGQAIPAQDSMRLLSMPEISLANIINSPRQSPKTSVFPQEPFENSKQSPTPSHTKSRGRRASTRSETCDVNRHFMCSVEDCNKVFKRSEHLKRHVRSIHTLEKPFPCPTCGKTFSRTDNLNQHVRIHSRPKTKVSTIRSRQAHQMHHPYHQINPNVQLDSLVGFMPFYSTQDHFAHSDLTQSSSNQLHHQFQDHPQFHHHPSMEPVPFQMSHAPSSHSSLMS